MESLYYVGLDVDKKTVSYCVKTAAGEKVGAGSVAANRGALSAWAEALPGPWVGALEATLFSGWIYDHLAGYAAELETAHPAMLKAIAGPRRRTTAWMRRRSATWRVAICCRAATWRRPRFASCGGCCAIATYSYARRCG